MNDETSLPLIARSVSVSSVRVTIPLEIVRKNEFKAGDKIAVRISGVDVTGADYVEFTATIRKFGVQYMFTIPAHAWPFVCDLGYSSGEAIPMNVTRAGV